MVRFYKSFRLVAVAAAAMQVFGAPCRWAPAVNTSQLVDPRSDRIIEVMRLVGEAEAAWVRGAGTVDGLGMTRDGANLNYTTGEIESLHQFSAPSKEGFQLGIAARCLARAAGTASTSASVGLNDAIWEQAKLALTDSLCGLGDAASGVEWWTTLLELKLQALQEFNSSFPGFGSHLPWYGLAGNGSHARMTLLSGWENRMPALDNGEMFWGLVAAARAASTASTVFPGHLGARLSAVAVGLRAQWRAMAWFAQQLFWGGESDPGSVWAVLSMTNASLPPSHNSYTPSGLLDDPYEGELYTWVIDLFGGLSPQQRMQLWVAKRPNLVRTRYVAPSETPLGRGGTEIDVQQGFWFSSHEQMKLLFLPYTNATLNPLAAKVFRACEVARATDSVARRVPGLFACVTDVAAKPTTPGQPPHVPGYISATGIQQVASQRILRRDVVTPYGAMAMALVAPREAAAWYVHSLKPDSMQGPVGSSCGCNVNGTEITPVATWDSKASTLLGFMGGVGDLTGQELADAGDAHGTTLLARFAAVVDRELRRVFGSSVAGADAAIPVPDASIPTGIVGQFTQCR